MEMLLPCVTRRGARGIDTLTPFVQGVLMQRHSGLAEIVSRLIEGAEALDRHPDMAESVATALRDIASPALREPACISGELGGQVGQKGKEADAVTASASLVIAAPHSEGPPEPVRSEGRDRRFHP